MNSADKFRRFAAECEAMAKIAPSAESVDLWGRMAARWLRCAEMAESNAAAITQIRMTRRHGRPSRAAASDPDAEAA